MSLGMMRERKNPYMYNKATVRHIFSSHPIPEIMDDSNSSIGSRCTRPNYDGDGGEHMVLVSESSKV